MYFQRFSIAEQAVASDRPTSDIAVKTETEFDLEFEIFLLSVSDLNHLLSSIKNYLRVKNIPEGIYKKANFVLGELANVEKN